MSSSVLFDAPGPKAAARHRLYTIISSIVILVLIGLAIWKLWSEGQFAYDLWEPFVTPRIVNVLVTGLLQTLLVAVIAVLLSVVFGLIFGTAKLSDHAVVRWPAWLVVEFFRAVPLLMVIIATWYAVGAKPGALAFWSLVIGLTLYNGSVLAEVFRAGINAVPRGQSEAAYAIGMRKTQVMNVILLPQAVRIMLPAIISQSVVTLKDTTLGYAITAPGIVYAARPVYQEFHNLLQTMIVLAAVFIIVNLGLTWLAKAAESRLAGGKHIDVPNAGSEG